MKQFICIITLTVLTAIPGSVLASDVEAGKSIASSVCVGCHGPEGKSINPDVAKSGRTADWISGQTNEGFSRWRA